MKNSEMLLKNQQMLRMDPLLFFYLIYLFANNYENNLISILVLKY